MNQIAYKGGYKYQLEKDYTINTILFPWKAVDTDFIKLTTTGELTIKKGYAWDGPSGPTIDTKDFMRGSLVHDALYQLFREGQLNHDKYRDDADILLRELCLEDGMTLFRAWYVYIGVKHFGAPYADPSADKPVVMAP